MDSVMRLETTLLLACAATLPAQNFPLAIVEKKAGAVGFYSPEGKRLAGVKVGEHPHEIVVAPDNRTLISPTTAFSGCSTRAKAATRSRSSI